MLEALSRPAIASMQQHLVRHHQRLPNPIAVAVVDVVSMRRGRLKEHVAIVQADNQARILKMSVRNDVREVDGGVAGHTGKLLLGEGEESAARACV